MAVWFLDDAGHRARLLDPYHPAFYLTGPPSALRAALRTLRHTHVTIRHVERRELGMRDARPVTEITVDQPITFTPLVRSLIRRFEHVQFYQADISLAQARKRCQAGFRSEPGLRRRLTRKEFRLVFWYDGPRTGPGARMEKEKRHGEEL